jgi:hypothetical protein
MAFFASLEFLFLFSSSFGKREVGGEEERKKKEEKRHPKLMAADLGAGLFGALKRVTGPKSWVLLATAAGWKEVKWQRAAHARAQPPWQFIYRPAKVKWEMSKETALFF